MAPCAAWRYEDHSWKENAPPVLWPDVGDDEDDPAAAPGTPLFPLLVGPLIYLFYISARDGAIHYEIRHLEIGAWRGELAISHEHHYQIQELTN